MCPMCGCRVSANTTGDPVVDSHNREGGCQAACMPLDQLFSVIDETDGAALFPMVCGDCHVCRRCAVEHAQSQ